MMEPLQTTGPLRCSGIAFASERTQFVLVRSHACAQVPHSSSSLWINIKEHIRANRTRSLSTVFIHSLTQRTWLKFTWNQTCVKSKLLICLPEEHPSLHYVSHSLSLRFVRAFSKRFILFFSQTMRFRSSRSETHSCMYFSILALVVR